jgi:predicted transcriptional regulator
MTAAEEGKQPAVPIMESVQPDFIVCLEDGRKMKMLKRHLRSTWKMSPEQYRARWGLPPNYPLVAPNYAKQKSKYAKHTGLGTAKMREDVKAARADA